MKGKIPKILSVALALVLVLSFSLVMAVPVAAAVSQPTVTFATDAEAAPDNVHAGFTIKFVSGVALTELDDTITIEFPAGTALGTIVGTVEGIAIATRPVVGQRVRITVPEHADIVAGDTVDVLFTTDSSDIDNPPDGDYTLKVYTSGEPTAVESETYTISEAVATVTAAPGPNTIGAVATYTIGFTTAEALGGDDAIVIDFPVNTNISNVGEGNVTVTGGVTVTSATPLGQVLTITLSDTLAPGLQTVTIANITNPTTLLNPDLVPPSNNWKLSVHTIHYMWGAGGVVTGIDGERLPAENDSAYTLSAETDISQVAWKTVDEYVPNETDGATPFVIETRDSYGNAVAVGEDTTFTLTASTGAFYSEAGCNTLTTTVQILDGASDSVVSDLYYKGAYNELTTGTVTITADETDSQEWTKAETTILVNPKLELWGGGARVGYYNTFALAMGDAMPFDTIKFAPSTYDGGISVEKADLTLESTGTAAETIIDGLGSANGIDITADADNVTIDGFTVKDASGYAIKVEDGADGATIKNNVMTATAGYPAGIYLDGARATVSGNVLDIHSPMLVSNTSDDTLSDNTFGAGINIDCSTGIDVINNDIIGSEGAGILFGSHASTNVLIAGNTISGTIPWDEPWSAAIAFEPTVESTYTGLQIIDNNIIDNLCPGMVIPATDVTLDAPVITNNTISGNVGYGILNLSGPGDVDAENNWWGDANGPSHDLVVAGDSVSADVDYDPWLIAAGGTPIGTDDFTVAAGWNLISLPLVPIDSDIEAVLTGSGVTINKVAYYPGGPAADWLTYSTTAPGNLTTMDDGKGYWIDVSVATPTPTFTVTGVELAPYGQVPPTYDVVAGWNLIGFPHKTPITAAEYLGSVIDTVEAMYEFDTSGGAYTAVLTGTELAKGAGYWLAVSAPGTIYP